MKKIMFFLKNFIQNPQTVGAVAASSVYLAKEICRKIPVNYTGVVSEFGPGTGTFTLQVRKQISKTCRFFAIEKNQEFYQDLKDKLPTLEIHHDDVDQVQKFNHLDTHNYIDYIVSGLPWSIFPHQSQDKLLDETVDSLNPGGYFSTFTYLTGYMMPNGIAFRKKLQERFETVEVSRVVWRNMLPAIVYHCKK